MNTYEDPEYRGYYLGKVAVAIVLLIIVVIAASRYPGATTAPAEAPATPVVESAQLTPGGLEATTSPATEASGTSAIAAGAPEAAQAAATGATPAAGTAAASVVESPVPMAAATAAQAGVVTAASGAVQAPATGAAEKDVAVSGTVYAPTTALSTSSLSAFSTTMGTPSDYQTHTVSGSHLTANININAPSSFEISTYGTTNYSSPIITVSTSSLSAFSTMVGTPSTAQTYTISGSDLTANISINAPAGFEISKDGSTYSSSLTLTQSGGTVAATTIYVRLTGAAEGSYGGNITHTSTGALATAAPGVAQAPEPGELGTGAPQAPATGAFATAAPGVAQAPGELATAAPAPARGAFATAAPGVAQAPGELATAAPAPAKLATAAPRKTVASAAATAGTATASPGLTITRAVVDDETGQVTLIGTGRPNAPIEIVQDGKAITRVVVKGDGTWKYTYRATPGEQVVAVQYEGQPNSRSLSLRFESTGVQAAAPTSAAPSQAGAGQAYIVKDGDFLRELAFRFYGDELQWPVIYDGTNAMAARDASFAEIDDPNLIEPGWKLWIPAK
jgi:nucleoid-associated protein YgaU